MTSTSVSSTSASFYEPKIENREEQITLLYQNIKMNLRDVNKAVSELDQNMQSIRKLTKETSVLMNEIELNETVNDDEESVNESSET